MKTLFRTQWNMPDLKSAREKNGKPSMTTPGQAMSLETLVKRFANGEPLSGTPGMYFGDEMLMPDFAKMDLAEIQELKETTMLRIATHQEKLKQAAEAQKEQKFNEAVLSKVKELEEQKSLNNSETK